MSPRFVLGRENVPCVAEVVNRSLKADCTDFTSDRIVGIQFAPPDQDPLFVFSVYFPSSNYSLTEFLECLYILWSLCEVYINEDPFIIADDYNAHLGKLVGARGYGRADKRGEKLLEFLHYFNLVVLNLLSLTSGPLYTFISENDKLKSPIDFIIVPLAFYQVFTHAQFLNGVLTF